MIGVIILASPLFIGYLLDLVLGDPAWMPHPARAIGWFARTLGNVVKWAFPRTEKGELAAGALLSLLVPVVSLLIPALLLAFAYTVHIALWFAFETMLCYQLISTRGLHDAGMRVYMALDKDEHGDLSRARLALSRVCGRDTGSMNRQEVIKTTVSVISESVVGGVVAPLLFMAVGGGALGVFYRAVSITAASDEPKSGGLGVAARTLANICNFIPAGIAALLLLFSSRISGLDAKNALRAYRGGKRGYGLNTRAQAVCAAALGISLDVRGPYDGAAPYEEDTRQAQPEDIRRTNRLLLFSSLFCAVLMCAAKFAVLYLILL